MAVSMLSPTTTRIATLALRVLTAILLFASLIILLTNTQQFQGPTLHFYDRVGYSYAAVGIFLGVAYSIYQTVCAVIRIKKGSEGNVVFDFYAEKVPLIIYSYLYLLIIDSKKNRYIIVYKRLHFKFLIIVFRVFL
ncbi:PREDICTED: CASP [Prunus dulcis]|uniref:CASP-like protein n=1 Tax=Prunus dulcis TaxID=3755 RepID=A0A5E4EAR5_PRUDU|nr:PREDICTED: CASP [Prunus dulcis]